MRLREISRPEPGTRFDIKDSYFLVKEDGEFMTTTGSKFVELETGWLRSLSHTLDTWKKWDETTTLGDLPRGTRLMGGTNYPFRTCDAGAWTVCQSVLKGVWLYNRNRHEGKFFDKEEEVHVS